MEKNVQIKFQASMESAIPTEAVLVLDLNELPVDPAGLADGAYLLVVAEGVATLVANPVPDPSGLANGNYQLTVLDGVLSWTAIV